MAELYAEACRGFALSLDDGRVERPQGGRERGACVRVVHGDSTYYGHVDGLAEQDLLRVAASVSEAVRGDAREPAALQSAVTGARHEVVIPPEEVEAARKAELLRACDERARAAGAEVVQARIGYAESHRQIEVFGSDGRAARDDRTRLRLSAEAVGHGLEADAVQKAASIYAGRLGEEVAPTFVTAYDDGSRPGAWGSEGVDDEGTPTRRTTIIEEGRLTSYLYDLLRARRDGVESTGNGRRESFRHVPAPRMTNTFFAPGDATPEDLIAGVERGLYAVSFGGGQVEPATGDFVFGVSEGYLIEDGAVTAPVRGATLIGNGLEALRAIDGIAGDLEIASGYCGKGGQTVAAGVGQPHVRIRELTVGGTAA